MQLNNAGERRGARFLLNSTRDLTLIFVPVLCQCTSIMLVPRIDLSSTFQFVNVKCNIQLLKMKSGAKDCVLCPRSEKALLRAFNNFAACAY